MNSRTEHSRDSSTVSKARSARHRAFPAKLHCISEIFITCDTRECDAHVFAKMKKLYRRRASAVPKVPRAERPRPPTIPSEVSSAPRSAQPGTTCSILSVSRSSNFRKKLYKDLAKIPDSKCGLPVACRANEISGTVLASNFRSQASLRVSLKQDRGGKSTTLVFQRLRSTLDEVPSCWYTKWPSSSDASDFTD